MYLRGQAKVFHSNQLQIAKLCSNYLVSLEQSKLFLRAKISRASLWKRKFSAAAAAQKENSRYSGKQIGHNLQALISRLLHRAERDFMNKVNILKKKQKLMNSSPAQLCSLNYVLQAMFSIKGQT